MRQTIIKHPAKDFKIKVGDAFRIGVAAPSGRITPDYHRVRAVVVQIGHQRGTHKPLVYMKFKHPVSGRMTTQIRLAEQLGNPVR